MRIFDLRILLSIWISIAGLLALQMGLSALKYRSLVIDAAAARLQIPAGTVEAAIAQARNLGMPVAEMGGLEALVREARDRTEAVRAVRVIDASEGVVIAAEDVALDMATLDRLRQRLITRGDAEGWIEIGDTLHVGRLVEGTEQAGELLVLMSMDRAFYGQEVASIRGGLIQGGIIIYVLTCLALTPFVIFLFRPARQILAMLEKADLDTTDDPVPTGDPLHDELAGQIVAGNRAEAQVARDLDRLAGMNAS